MGEATLQEFVQAILESKAGKVDKKLMQNMKEITNVEEHGEEAEWISWHAAKQKETESALQNMVLSKTILSRQHPKLPPDSKLEWPENLQVKFTKEVVSKKTLRKTREAHVEMEEAREDVAEDFGKR